MFKKLLGIIGVVVLYTNEIFAMSPSGKRIVCRFLANKIGSRKDITQLTHSSIGISVARLPKPRLLN